MRSAFLILGASFAFLVAGCTPPKSPATAPPGATTSANKGPRIKTLKVTQLQAPKEGKYFKSPSGATFGDHLWAKYTGMLVDGTVIDTTEGEDKHPYAFKMEPGEVIDGWLEGLKGMRIGEKRKLEIPADMAYGNNTEMPDIPPDSDLIFTVELVDMVKKGEEQVFDVKDLVIGTGPVAKKGSFITIHYEGKLTDGTLFDSSARRKKPLTVRLGADEIQPDALDAGIMGMKVGGERVIRIPPTIGLPVSERVPKDNMQYFFVKLLSVE